MAGRVVCLLSVTLLLVCGPGTCSPPTCPPKDIGRPMNGFRYEDCSAGDELKGEQPIDKVQNFCFVQNVQDSLAAVRVQWNPSPFGIEYLRGFKIILREAKVEGALALCQLLVLEERRQLKNFNRTLVMKSLPFRSLKFKTLYNVQILPFPNLMHNNSDTFQFEIESCENLLKRDNLTCKKYWSPNNLSVTQPYQSMDLNVTFDPAPLTYGFKAYHIRCKMVNTVFHKDKNISVDNNMTTVSYVFENLYPGHYLVEVTDSANSSGKLVNFTVKPVHFPWAGPIRAIAITVPLVIVSAIVTLFTVLCCKKQQNPVYSELDEENSETAPSPRSKPKVFICYSNKDGHKHLTVVQCFAFFLQDFCGCEVILDLWEHLEICREGRMDWLSQQIKESHYIIVICSKGMKYFVEKRHRRRRGGLRDDGGTDLFIVAVSMIGERLRQARLISANTSRFIALHFDYSCEADIPGVLDLACKYKLMDHFPQLYSHLHARDQGGGGREPPALHISKSNYFRSRSGRSLYIAICDMKQMADQEPDWFQRQLRPTLASVARHHPGPVRVDSGLVLNEVVFKQPVTIADVTPVTLGSHPLVVRRLSVCGEDLDIAGRQEAISLLRPLPQRAEPTALTLPEMPRDSGIYDSSIPSSELSLPLMEGLYSDQTETYSIADSVSSSSGLGEEDPPVVMAPKSAVSRVCKVELDRHIHSAMVSL